MAKTNLLLDFDYNFELLSIISSVRDYRLCWELNKKLQLDFVRQDDIEIHDKRKRHLAYFNLFLFEDEPDFLQYYFISNKSTGVYLIPELKQVDYFLMIKGSTAHLYKSDLMKSLKEFDTIEALIDTNPYELRSKQNLIFE